MMPPIEALFATKSNVEFVTLTTDDVEIKLFPPMVSVPALTYVSPVYVQVCAEVRLPTPALIKRPDVAPLILVIGVFHVHAKPVGPTSMPPPLSPTASVLLLQVEATCTRRSKPPLSAVTAAVPRLSVTEAF